LAQTCDSCFAIGKSTSDNNIRYIKQLKERSIDNLYGEDNVVVCQIEKPDNFLKFTFLQFGKESTYLKPVSEDEKKELIDNILSLHAKGKSLGEIAKELCISKSKVQRVTDKAKTKDEDES
jgi:hypothetical protein